jgi:hypothetical protein
LFSVYGLRIGDPPLADRLVEGFGLEVPGKPGAFFVFQGAPVAEGAGVFFTAKAQGRSVPQIVL